MIYDPREDSYLIEKEVKKYSKEKKVLDMGSGSGILALSAMKSGAKSVLAVDIDIDAVKYLKKIGLNATQSDLFKNVKGKFDLIIFNPPYLPLDKREDKKSRLQTTGGKKGDEIILRFLKDVNNFLEEKGIILVLISSLTPVNRILNLIKRKKLNYKIISREKYFMEELQVWEFMQRFKT